MARQAKAYASSNNQAARPTRSKPPQTQNAAAIIQGGLVSVIMVQSQSLISPIVDVSVASQPAVLYA
jgi:hypothetical protein